MTNKPVSGDLQRDLTNIDTFNDGNELKGENLRNYANL